MPLAVAAIAALLQPKSNAHGTTGSLASPAHMVLVSGPARHDLGINCRSGCFGPGSRPNAVVGRTIRLVLRNCCNAIPGFADRGAFSQPARYSFCFGEDEEGSTWVPIHVERGFAPDANVATVSSFTQMYALRDVSNDQPCDLLRRFASMARSRPVHRRPCTWQGTNRPRRLRPRASRPSRRRRLVEAGCKGVSLPAPRRASVWHAGRRSGRRSRRPSRRQMGCRHGGRCRGEPVWLIDSRRRANRRSRRSWPSIVVGLLPSLVAACLQPVLTISLNVGRLCVRSMFHTTIWRSSVALSFEISNRSCQCHQCHTFPAVVSLGVVVAV